MRDVVRTCVTLIDALGNGTRLAILRELSREPMYVSELAAEIGMDGKTAVHHLSTLEDAGLVEHYRRGNRKYYELARRIELRIAPPPGARSSCRPIRSTTRASRNRSRREILLVSVHGSDSDSGVVKVVSNWPV